MEELRLPNMRPMDNDIPTSGALSRQRDSNPFYPGLGPSAPDVPHSLQTRFNTECGRPCLGVDAASKDEVHGLLLPPT